VGAIVLERLGVSAEAEAIYWAMLEHPDWGVEELAQDLAIPESTVRDALSALADQALVQPSWSQPGALRAVSPQVGLFALLERFEARVRAQQETVAATRAMVMALAAGHDDKRRRDELIRLEGIDAVRDRLTALAQQVERECMTFTTGSALSPETIESGKALNRRALERGVQIRNVYQRSILNDKATEDYARWMASLGGRSRTTPLVPLRMTIVDRAVALVPIDPDDSSRGALEVRGTGLVTALCLLFDTVWEHGAPFGEQPTVNDDGLNDQEAAILGFLRAGLTDEAIGRKLRLSERTVRRTVSDLMKRLDATSRFQAGAEAAARNWC
jgi:DNA-binding CsgD family transcriptional regulator/sugar-specific transcriptional regulator TrmB